MGSSEAWGKLAGGAEAVAERAAKALSRLRGTGKTFAKGLAVSPAKLKADLELSAALGPKSWPHPSWRAWLWRASPKDFEAEWERLGDAWTGPNLTGNDLGREALAEGNWELFGELLASGKGAHLAWSANREGDGPCKAALAGDLAKRRDENFWGVDKARVMKAEMAKGEKEGFGEEWMMDAFPCLWLWRSAAGPLGRGAQAQAEALVMAAWNCETGLVRALLADGADPNGIDETPGTIKVCGGSALGAALAAGSAACAMILLAAGASPRSLGPDGAELGARALETGKMLSGGALPKDLEDLLRVKSEEAWIDAELPRGRKAKGPGL